MKELINNVSIKGELVKIEFEEFTTKKNDDAISGSLILRTSDGSEHEIKYYSNKYKKDKDGHLTGELNANFEKYKKFADELKDMNNCVDGGRFAGEKPDVISITDGAFTVNDYKSTKTGELVALNEIFSKFINVVPPKDYENTVLEAKFEVQGVIESMKDEIIKNAPTGNLIVNFLAINMKNETNDWKNPKFVPDSLIPIKMIVTKDKVDGFRRGGYYDGCFTKFVGKVINTVEMVELVEEQAFGDPVVKLAKNYIRRNEILSGSTADTIFQHDITQEVFDTLRAKRRLKLEEVKSGRTSSNNESSEFASNNNSTDTPKPTFNPFAAN